MIISLSFRKVFPPLCVLMCSREQLTINAGMAVTFFCCFIDFKKAFDQVDYWLLVTIQNFESFRATV